MQSSTKRRRERRNDEGTNYKIGTISTNIKRASVSDPEDLERLDSRFNV
jgi:hypothetical protein